MKKDKDLGSAIQVGDYVYSKVYPLPIYGVVVRAPVTAGTQEGTTNVQWMCESEFTREHTSILTHKKPQVLHLVVALVISFLVVFFGVF